jgi:hypothetical protein
VSYDDYIRDCQNNRISAQLKLLNRDIPPSVLRNELHTGK